MTIYNYKGSNPTNHIKLTMIAASLGLQNIRKMPMGNYIAQKANEGSARFIEACEAHPEFFEKVTND